MKHSHRYTRISLLVLNINVCGRYCFLNISLSVSQPCLFFIYIPCMYALEVYVLCFSQINPVQPCMVFLIISSTTTYACIITVYNTIVITHTYIHACIHTNSPVQGWRGACSLSQMTWGYWVGYTLDGVPIHCNQAHTHSYTIGNLKHQLA